MHKCPYCNQEVNSFAFYCLRCSKPIGQVVIEGELLALWWIDTSNNPLKKAGMKTLKRGNEYLNVASISPPQPSPDVAEITFTLSNRDFITQKVSDFFAQAVSPSQEWNI